MECRIHFWDLNHPGNPHSFYRLQKGASVKFPQKHFFSPRRWRATKHNKQNLLLFSGSSNLGELERFAGTDPGLSSFEYQGPVSTYVPEPRFDGPVATVSILLFLLLTAIASDRILGLSRFFNEALLKWKERRAYERRNETIEARERLEAAFSEEEDDDKGGG